LQSDLLQLLQPFGAVSKIVMLRAKNQVSSSFFRAVGMLNGSIFFSFVLLSRVCFGGAGTPADGRGVSLHRRGAILQQCST
jgi:hypothetical protein